MIGSATDGRAAFFLKTRANRVHVVVDHDWLDKHEQFLPILRNTPRFEERSQIRNFVENRNPVIILAFLFLNQPT